MTDLSWLILLLLAALDLLIVSVRASFVNLQLSELNKLLAQHGEARIGRVSALAEKPRFRASLRLATGAMHFLIAGAVLAFLQGAQNAHFSLGQSLLATLVAAAILLLVEFVFEGLILRNPEAAAIHLAPLAFLLDWVLTPVTFLLVTLWGRPHLLPGAAAPLTEDTLRTWVEEGQAAGGGLEQGERQMIYSILQFGDTLAREIMIPRIDLMAFEITMPLAEAVEGLTHSGHSRVPVYEGTIENIVGMLYAKDLLLVKDQPVTLAALRDRLRPPYFIPETKKVDALLTEMQSRRIHVAIVVDEYGGVAGMVTLEDIVEEIVGEIRDEYDQGEEQLFQKVGPDEYVFQGKIDLDDFNQVMGTHLEKDDADTLAGFIYGQMGRVPAGGERVELPDLILTVEQVSGRRIRKVRAQRIQPTQEKEVENTNAD